MFRAPPLIWDALRNTALARQASTDATTTHGGMATATGPHRDPFECQETAAWRGEQRKLLLSERVENATKTRTHVHCDTRRDTTRAH